MKKIIYWILCSLIFSSCSCKSNEEKRAIAQMECSKKTKIDGLNVNFMGYFPYEADSINVKIKRGNKLIEDFNDKIPDTIEDSLRHLRVYLLNKEILLTDTVIFKIKNEPEKKAYNFKYFARAPYNMFNSNAYSCYYSEVTVNSKIMENGLIMFMKLGFDTVRLERENFRQYYKK